MLRINFNDTVHVRLTRRGVDRYRDWVAETTGRRVDPPMADAQGYRRFQLWDMMACFGPVIAQGVADLFELDAWIDLSTGKTDEDGTQTKEKEATEPG